MPKTQFIFDFGSPNAFLSHLVLADIEKRTGVDFDYFPVLLGGIFKLTNNVPPFVAMDGIKNKREYYQIEVERFIAKHNIAEVPFNPFFPVNTLNLMRGAVVAEREGFFQEYIQAMFHHMWVEPKKMDDLEVFSEVLRQSNLPSLLLLNGIKEDKVKKALFENTEKMVSRGVFGSPSFFVDDALFFGKDKLQEVEDEIRRKLNLRHQHDLKNL